VASIVTACAIDVVVAEIIFELLENSLVEK
jgi:hypothetical protein